MKDCLGFLKTLILKEIVAELQVVLVSMSILDSNKGKEQILMFLPNSPHSLISV